MTDTGYRCYRVRDVARWCGARPAMTPSVAARAVCRLIHDSRMIKKGDVFVALRSPADDGHRYVPAALKAGAVAAVVDRAGARALGGRLRGRLIVVNDTLAALQRCALNRRIDMGLLVVGVTGSSGKTTTRLFIHEVLSTRYPAGGTQGNWNNHIGVPLSIMGLDGKDYAAVIEMGANHRGEIALLSGIARPDIAVITNVGYAHVGLFGSLENTAAAKFEIVKGLAADGILLLNGDDRRLRRRGDALRRRVVYFGLGRRCHVRAENVTVAADGCARFTVDGYAFRLTMPGRHFVSAVLPAIWLGRRCGIEDRVIAAKLAKIRPAALRGTIESRRGVRFIVDCYNANPSSMKSALTLLGDVAPKSRRVAVLGDMKELGGFSRGLHRALGRNVAAAGVRAVIFAGEFAAAAAAGARTAGMKRTAVYGVENADEARTALRRVARRGDTVLLKASRALRFETVYERF